MEGIYNNYLNISFLFSPGEFLSSRSWRGLEQDLGKTPVIKAVEGRKGIAASYANEPDAGIAAVSKDDDDDDDGTPV